MSTQYPPGRRKRLAVLFWLLFGGGLLVRLLAPNLERTKEAFVVPMALSQGQKTLNPAQIVAKERRMQLISAVLTASGALGLGFLYREGLLRRSPRQQLSGQATSG
jgi:hypothetical protein